MGVPTSKILRLALPALTAAALTACGGGGEISTPDVESFAMPSGLACVAMDTHKAGGVDCDLAGFTPPAGWANRTGAVEAKDVGAGTVTVTSMGRGVLCVSLDGYESGGLRCHWPAR